MVDKKKIVATPASPLAATTTTAATTETLPPPPPKSSSVLSSPITQIATAARIGQHPPRSIGGSRNVSTGSGCGHSNDSNSNKTTIEGTSIITTTSIGGIGNSSSSGGRHSRNSSFDLNNNSDLLLTFQQSWSNTDSVDFLGGGGAVAFGNSASAVPPPPSSPSFLHQPSPVTTRTSTSSSLPRPSMQGSASHAITLTSSPHHTSSRSLTTSPSFRSTSGGSNAPDGLPLPNAGRNISTCSSFGAASTVRAPSPLMGGSGSNSSSCAAFNYCDANAGLSSVIHDAARITDWDRVQALCATQPDSAAYSGRDGWTALHHACNRRCPHPHVVEALIKSYPGALLQEDEKMWLPLHYACRFKAPKEVIRLLLHMQPDSGKVAVSARDKLGRLPLYYAIRYDAPEGVVELLLQLDPTAVLEEDQNEDSPLALIWDDWADKLEGKRIVHSFLPGGFPEKADTSAEERATLLLQRLDEEPTLKKKWHRVNQLLKAAFGFPFEEEEDTNSNDDDTIEQKLVPKSLSNDSGHQRQWRIVHATAAVKCHTSLNQLACALHPEQAKELDQCDLQRPDIHGNIPDVNATSFQTALHLAASSNAGGEPGKTIIITLLSLYREAAEQTDGVDGSLPLHRMVENPVKTDWPTHAAILYHFYPRAVQIADQNDRLPLHRAAAAGTLCSGRVNNANARAVVNDGGDNDDQNSRSVIIQLVRNYPQACGVVDSYGCLPIHYLAMNAESWDAEVESVYNANRNGMLVRSNAVMDNRLPIHMAAANTKAKASLIQRIIQVHPRGSSVEERQGKLPLHIACENGMDWTGEGGGAQYIYDAFPDAVRSAEHNSRGWLPLHMAAACNGASTKLITKLVEFYPDAAGIADTNGRYPFHLACTSGKSWHEGLKAMFDAYPNSLSSADNQGILPIHIAALRYCNGDDDEVKYKTRSVANIEAQKEQTVTTAEAAELDILFNLVRADPSSLQLSE